MSIQAVAWVLDHSEARALERLVLIAMANHDNQGLVGVSKATIAHECRISDSEVWRCQAVLEKAGEIRKVDATDAPEWWLEIPANRRPNLWEMAEFVRSRDAMSEAVQGSRRGRVGVALSRHIPVVPVVPNQSALPSRTATPGLVVNTAEECDRCHAGWILDTEGNCVERCNHEVIPDIDLHAIVDDQPTVPYPHSVAPSESTRIR